METLQKIKAQGREFVVYGKMLIEASIAPTVMKLAPRGDEVRTWENDQFKRLDYRAIRDADFYTESVYYSPRTHALIVIPAVPSIRSAAFAALAILQGDQ